MSTDHQRQIGLAVIGCGTIGRIRAELARAYPGVGWLGLCDLKSDLGRKLEADTKADFFTNDYRELLCRPEVTAAIIATDENFHFEPTMAAIERGLDPIRAAPATRNRGTCHARRRAGCTARRGVRSTPRPTTSRTSEPLFPPSHDPAL